MGSKTKIDWCDSSWNPVTGCLHGCEYCYARRIAERFGSKQKPESIERSVLNAPMRCTDLYSYMRMAGISQGKVQPYPFDFSPTFHRYKLDEPKHWKKPRTIFVCSMADLFGEWVPDEWIEQVFEACKAAPQHRYLFLTKNLARYDKLIDSGILPEHCENMWYGSTCTDITQMLHWNRNAHTFMSCEPMLAPWYPAGGNGIAYIMPEWVIFGAETGNRKKTGRTEKRVGYKRRSAMPK